MKPSYSCRIELPAWMPQFLENWQEPLISISQRMQLVIALSMENVQKQTGGPFAAIVIDEDSKELVSAGVNLVTTSGLSMAHAEVVALSLAQTSAGGWNLAQTGVMQLVSSCEPCAMCFGALPWSGVKSLVCGARKKDAEAVGFDEGSKPTDWVKSLQRLGIVVQTRVLQKQAAAVLMNYRDSGGSIYNAE